LPPHIHFLISGYMLLFIALQIAMQVYSAVLQVIGLLTLLDVSVHAGAPSQSLHSLLDWPQQQLSVV
jgi:hypothetical protein